jgi:hypothetical protein
MLMTITIGCVYRLRFRENPFGIQAIILMGLVGLVLLGLGKSHASRRMSELAILGFYRSFRFYGTVVSVTASLLFVYALMLRPPVPAQARVASVAPPVVVKPVPKSGPEKPPAAPVAPKFPELKLTGVILNGSRSSAVINQRPVTKGEFIEGVQLVEVHEKNVVVEMNGFRKTISRFVLPTMTTNKKSGK